MKAALGLDIGTTSVKAVALSAAGEVVAKASSPPLSLTAPESGWAVQSTDDLSAAVFSCLRELCGVLPEGTELVALSAAVQSGSLVVVGADGAALAHMTTWMDTRSAEVVARWDQDATGAMIRRVSGWSAQPGLGLAQLVWLCEHKPEAFRQAATFGSADDFAMSRLTGRWVTNPSNAAGMQLIDIGTGVWSPALCELAGVTTAQLSQLEPSGDQIGSITAGAAAATGLPLGLPVINGGHDQTCTALALGVDEPGRALLAVGTAWVLTTVVDADNLTSVPEEMNVSFHVVDGLRTTSRYLGGLGASMEWWISEARYGATVADDAARYHELDAELATTTITIDSPYFLRTSDTDEAAARPGAGRFWPAGSDAHRTQRAIAIMEFAAFEVRTALAALPPSHRPEALTAVGGATSSPGWAQIISDVCGLPVKVVPAHSWPAVGAALLAGRSRSLFEGRSRSDDPSNQLGSEVLEPSPASVSLHNDRYSTHLELSQENRS